MITHNFPAISGNPHKQGLVVALPGHQDFSSFLCYRGKHCGLISPSSPKMEDLCGQITQILPMPSVRPYGTGYRAQVYVKGVRDSETFDTRRKANEWAAARDAELRSGLSGQSSKTKTTHQAFDEYADKVSPTKNGERWEVVRLMKFKRDFPLVTMEKLNSDHVKAWRDKRLKEVQGSSVLREMKLLASVFEHCRLELKWLAVNRCRDVKKPAAPPHRNTVITIQQMKAILRELGYPRRDMPRNAVGYAFRLALMTGMRQGELASITWSNVRGDHVHLPVTKNGKARDVPLSKHARKLIARMRGYHDTSVFNLTAGAIDVQFRQARARANLKGFTFHDSRHTAATRIGMSRKLSLELLCVMFGWSDPKMAMIYFNPTPSDIADLL